MITHLRGTLLSKSPTYAVVDVGGVGYGLAISLITFDQLPPASEAVHLSTYLYVREDRMELFGFADEEEREVFELLIGVSGIGPHSALTVLSGMTLRDLQEAILQERVAELTAIKGIGRKTAERLVLDLKDKVRFERLGVRRSGLGGQTWRERGGGKGPDDVGVRSACRAPSGAQGRRKARH